MPAKATRKPRKTAKNRPITFQETMTPALPLAPALPLPAALPGLPRWSRRTVRNLLVTIWVLAALAAGIGLGLRFRYHPVAASPAPAPVAIASLSVTRTTAAGISAIAAPQTQNLHVTPSASVNQADIVPLFAATSATSYQPAAGPEALQPGYASAASPQGTQGTDPVE